MPGRKSNLSTVTNGEDGSPAPPPSRAPREGTSVEDLALPRTMISRLAKGVLPPNTSIHKDALLAMSKSCTVFVNFLAANANEYAQLGGKKTIQPADVISALKENEFESFIPRLEAELKRYNTVQCDKRNSYRRKIREEKATSTSTLTAGGGEEEEEEEEEQQQEAEEEKPADAEDASVPDDNETSKSTIAVAATATATATATAAGARNGNRTDQEPPSKKIRREAGGEEDVSEDEEFHDAMENEDEEVVEGDEEEDEDEEVEDEDEDEDEDDEEDERAVGNGLRDEALDDASEDSD